VRITLRKAMDRYAAITGERMTYPLLAQRTGLARSTIESLASRAHYNTRLSTIEKLCLALRCQPGDLLTLEDGR
jgi:DNA-binding Xre family transcriptional regulator